MRNRPIVALDLGASKVACVIARPDAQQGVEVLGTGLARYPRPAASWPRETALMAQTIEQALDDTGVEGPFERAVVTLTHPDLTHYDITTQIDLAAEPVAIRRQAIDRLRAQAIAQAVGIDREALLIEALGYDGNGFERVKDPRGLAATRLRGTFRVVAIPVAVRRAVIQALEAVGLEAERLMYSLRAIATACLDEPTSLKRVLLIDIGGCATDAAVIEQRSLYRSLTIPWGGLSVVRAIAEACHLTMEQALTASLEGFASPKPAVRKIVERELGLLRGSLHELLKEGALPDLAIVTGGGALMDGVVEWIESITEITTRLGRSQRIQRLKDVSEQVAFTAAIGLVESVGRPSALRARPGSPLELLVERTKTILTEYF